MDDGVGTGAPLLLWPELSRFRAHATGYGCHLCGLTLATYAMAVTHARQPHFRCPDDCGTYAGLRAWAAHVVEHTAVA